MTDLQEMADNARTVVLERLKVSSLARIGRHLIDEAGLRVAADVIADELILQLTSRVTAEHLATDSVWVEYELPEAVRELMDKEGAPTGHYVMLKQYAVYPTLPIGEHPGYPAVIPADED